MKKIVLAILVTGSFTMTSCSKQRTCKCTDNSTGVEMHEYKITGTKKNCKAACDTYDSSAMNMNCEIVSGD